MSVSLHLAEDFPLLREALGAALAQDRRLAVRRSCATARDMLEALAIEPVDVAICDLQLPDLDGIELIARVRRLHPSVRVVVFTACERAGRVQAALEAGAHGYLVKRQAIDQVADSIIEVASGGVALAPQITGAALRGMVSGSNEASAIERLQPADLEVVRMVVAGRTDDQIARSLFVSTRTVQNHLARLRRRAGVRRRTELACWAIENALV